MTDFDVSEDNASVRFDRKRGGLAGIVPGASRISEFPLEPLDFPVFARSREGQEKPFASPDHRVFRSSNFRRTKLPYDNIIVNYYVCLDRLEIFFNTRMR